MILAQARSKKFIPDTSSNYKVKSRTFGEWQQRITIRGSSVEDRGKNWKAIDSDK